MANCFGTRKSAGICNSSVHQCDECANTGCDQIEAGECSNQGFGLGTCVSCGKARFLSAVDLVRILETTQSR
jgi:hypothetical protein